MQNLGATKVSFVNNVQETDRLTHVRNNLSINNIVPLQSDEKHVLAEGRDSAGRALWVDVQARGCRDVHTRCHNA